MQREYWRWRGGVWTKIKVGPKKSRTSYDPPFYKCWPNRPGTGKAAKRAYHSFRRQENHREVIGDKVGKRSAAASACKWKGW